MNLVKIISTEIDSKLTRRILKFFRMTKDDANTAAEIAPFGIDANPIKDMVALYGETGQNGQTVIIGYINKNAKAKPGEVRIYSLDPTTGTEMFYTYHKADGTYELNGKIDNLVRYAKLDAALQAEVALINVELAKIAVVLNSHFGPGTYPVTPITINTLAAKILEAKTS